MGKTIAMISESPEIEELCGRINQRKLFSEKKMLNFKKQLQDAQHELAIANNEDWLTLTSWLENKGRLPEKYNKQTHSISFNIKDNGIQLNCVTDEPPHRSEHPFQEGVKMMSFGELPPEFTASLFKFLESQPKKEE